MYINIRDLQETQVVDCPLLDKGLRFCLALREGVPESQTNDPTRQEDMLDLSMSLQSKSSGTDVHHVYLSSRRTSSA